MIKKKKVETPLEQKAKRWEVILQNILALETVREYSADMDNWQFFCEIMGLIKSSLLKFYAMYKVLGTLY